MIGRELANFQNRLSLILFNLERIIICCNFVNRPTSRGIFFGHFRSPRAQLLRPEEIEIYQCWRQRFCPRENSLEE